jgi:dTMP kinase
MNNWYKIAQKDNNKKEKSTVSIAVFRKHNGKIEILLEKRGYEPCKGEWSFPGGHVEDKESYSQAAIRELEEETGIKASPNGLIEIVRRAKRVPEEHKENVVFAYFQEDGKNPKAMSDAADVKWHKVESIPCLSVPSLAFEDEKYILPALAGLLMWALSGKSLQQIACQVSFCNCFLKTAQTIIDEETKKTVNGILTKASPEKSGLLIVFEGCDGVGKTTQVEKLVEWLKKQKYDVVQTKWSDSDLLKKSIKSAKEERILTPILYSLIHAADMVIRYEQIIEPALSKNRIVVCDRYTYTSLVRDAVRGIDTDIAETVYKNFRKPDLIFNCYAPIEVAFTRLLKGKGLSFYGSGHDLNLAPSREENALKYEKLMSDEYKSVLKEEAHCFKIDMDRKVDNIFEDVKKIMADEFGIGKYKL